MQVTETLSEGLKREFKVVVGADDLESRVTSRLSELARDAQMPGFRRGKVPVSLLRRTYGKQVMGEVLEQAVNETTSETLERHEVKPALQPRIEITKFEEGADLEFTMSVEVMPEFEPIDFATLKLERLTAEVDDAEVDERLKQLAEQFKTFEDAAEGQEAKDGDNVVIDFKGFVDGEAFAGGEAEDFSLELGSGSFVPGFEEQLVGAKASEQRKVTITFPEEYGAENLAGKTAEFEVTVKQVKVPLPTAVDDALAEKLGLENLDALKTAVREQTERDYAELTRARLKRALLDSLAETHDFAVPPGMVEMEFEQIWEQVKEDLERQGKTLEELDKPEEEARQEYRDIAERRVRLGLLLSEVGRRNNLQVSQDEVNRAIAQQAARFPGQERQVMEFYQGNPEMRSQLQAPILEDKVVDFILALADVTERKVPVEELTRDPDEEEEGGGTA
ncbi:MAG TPA: trigger factor [Alphaproteobacteria bacterium]|jgi:trigger factor|nr:trigger factor [Alphaproteobacteria bacterium]